ncbi:hypothetical protein IF2G_03150 [Cordyceps javanica]|nr:hypothetical protein IF2G_03150 [Cordyceps javanica]
MLAHEISVRWMAAFAFGMRGVWTASVNGQIRATYTPQRSPPWPRLRSPAAEHARRSRRSGAWGRSTAWTACTLYTEVSMPIAGKWVSPYQSKQSPVVVAIV